jgi:sodium transport system permease protein
MVPYFLIFAILLGGFYLAIDTTAGERERGSLEPLLGTAAPRSALIYGKLGATIVFSILALAVSVAAFAVSLPLVHLEKIGLAINMNATVAWNMFLVAVPFTVVGGAILTVVASLTKSFKEAQTWLSVVLVIPLIPTIVTALYPVRAAWWMMLVPSLSQNLLLTDLLKGSALDPTHVLLSFSSTLLIGLVLAWVAARLFSRESIVD